MAAYLFDDGSSWSGQAAGQVVGGMALQPPDHVVCGALQWSAARQPPPWRDVAAGYRRRTRPQIAAGKGKKGAMRCLKRRLSDAVFRALIRDLQAAQAAGPEGNSGRRQVQRV